MKNTSIFLYVPTHSFLQDISVFNNTLFCVAQRSLVLTMDHDRAYYITLSNPLRGFLPGPGWLCRTNCQSDNMIWASALQWADVEKNMHESWSQGNWLCRNTPYNFKSIIRGLEPVLTGSFHLRARDQQGAASWGKSVSLKPPLVTGAQTCHSPFTAGTKEILLIHIKNATGASKLPETLK